MERPVCREEGCDEPVIEIRGEAETVRTAPGWHFWPVPAPDHMARTEIVGYHVTEICDGGHQTTRFERPLPA